MIMIGIDAHKKTHTLVAVDRVGRRLGDVTLPATTAGHLRAVQWAAEQAAGVAEREQDGLEVRFAVEDCRHLTRRLEADLLCAGLPVVRVHTRLMAGLDEAAASLASPIRLMPRPWQLPRCGHRTCRWRSWTGLRGRSSC